MMRAFAETSVPKLILCLFECLLALTSMCVYDE